MRVALILTIAATLPAFAQEPVQPANPAPRFNVLFNTRFFKQATPKETLASVIRAGELGQYDYIASYLMDESAANALILDRAKEYEAAAERDLRAIRTKEHASPFAPRSSNPLPMEPAEFAKRVQVEATWRGYYQLVKEIRERFVNDPSHLRELQRFFRDGEVTVTESTAVISIRKEKGVALYFKKVGDRWFIEDRKQEPKPATPANP